jgi:CheY-like chemotaxis protein
VAAAQVLIVDDEAEVREGIAQLLRSAGFSSVGVANGAEALDLLRGGFPAQAIVLDLMMPVMDGWEFRREQLRDPRLVHIPVVVLSALSDAWVEGIPTTLPKPIDFARLKAHLVELTATDSHAPRFGW